jgi:SAM-dependent methyltransferase
LPTPPPSPLTLSKPAIRRQGLGGLLAVCWRQCRTERALAQRGIHFRSTDPDRVAAAYAAMSVEEFDAINGRQDWANWRTIPRCLCGHVPARPLRILDLGCGTGSSTRVLACCAPAGSHITGYELAGPLLAVARGRSYTGDDGQPAHVDFCCQAVTEPLRQADGRLMPEQSVDVVNASGVIGHHLNERTIAPLVSEIRRVLPPDGIAMLDVGPSLGERALTRILRPAGFHKLGRWRSWWLDQTGEVVYVRDGPSNGESPG